MKLNHFGRSEVLENFDEYLINDINPVEFLKNGPKNGYSRFITLDGEVPAWRECEILSYNSQTKKFLIKFFNTEIKKEVKNRYFCILKYYFFII